MKSYFLIKTSFISFLLLLFVSGCATRPIDGSSQLLAPLPEPVNGLNFFVYVNVVPVAAAERDKLAMPDPLKVVLAETEVDDRSLQARLAPLLAALREHVHLPFRNAGIPVESYVAGGRYAWDELRRDRRNYRLTIWTTLSQAPNEPEQADLWFALQNENSGRRVWSRVVKNAFASPLASGADLDDSRRIALANAIAQDTMEAMRRDGINLPER